MTATNNSLNKYKVVWVEFRALRGIVNKHDIRVIDSSFAARTRRDITGRYFLPFGSLESAEKYLKQLEPERLSKQYEVRYCYDVQFSRAHVDPVTHVVNIKYTRKQEEEKQVIGPNK